MKPFLSITLLGLLAGSSYAGLLDLNSPAIIEESHWRIVPRIEDIQFEPDKRHLRFTIVYENAGSEAATFTAPDFKYQGAFVMGGAPP